MLVKHVFKRAIKRVFLYFVVAFSISSVAFFINTFYYDYIDPFDKKLQDYMFKFRGVIKHDNNVVIVDIDEKSLNELGQWPWPRDKVSKILENLTSANVGVIGLDIVFAEKDQSSPAKVLKDLGMQNIKAPDFDHILEQMVKNTPTILGYQFVFDDKKFAKKDELNIPGTIFEKGNADAKEILSAASGIVLNYRKLQEMGYSSGFFNIIPDNTGVVRSVPMVIKYNDRLFSSLAFEVLRASAGIKNVYVNYDEAGITDVQMGDYKIPTDRHGNFMVNFRGPNHTFKYYSAVDIFNGDFEEKEFESKVVLIGTTAAGLYDMRTIAFESVYPGVEIHANIIDNILTGDFLHFPSWVEGANILILYLVPLIAVLLIAYVSFWIKPVVVVSMILSIYYGGYYYLFTDGIVINVFLPIITVFIASAVTIFVEYWFELRQQKMIKNKFAAKVSKDVMDNLLQNPQNNVFMAMQKEVTVFFSDVRNFTNISESMPDARTLIEFMNDYMDPMTEIIIEQKGTVDKFIGDAIMAYWNAPLDVENHADKAVIATLNQLYKVKELNEKVMKDERFKNTVKMCMRKDLPIIEIGIGINTGEVIVGEMGSSKRSDYTIIGDAVNLGSRLESLCKFYGSKCNISNFTKEQLKGDYIYRFLDVVTVKGQSKPVEIWQIIDFDKDDNVSSLYDVSREKLNYELFEYHKAIELYKNTKFKEALMIFKRLEDFKEKTNKKIYEIYIQRCENYIINPPDDFDGVFRHNSKG